jgi:anti-sigma regulatory factor (Ser/Thr protein kinase)
MQRHFQPGSRYGPSGHGFAFYGRPPGGPGKKTRMTVEFEAGPTAAASARNALRALDGRVDEELLADVRLLVSELVTNSVRHSNIRARDCVSMEVEVIGPGLRVEVADPGKGFEPRPRDDDRSRPGGWGLYLVEQLADRWGVEGGDETRVWFEIENSGRRVA